MHWLLYPNCPPPYPTVLAVRPGACCCLELLADADLVLLHALLLYNNLSAKKTGQPQMSVSNCTAVPARAPWEYTEVLLFLSVEGACPGQTHTVACGLS
jgi:hypothetical protein